MNKLNIKYDLIPDPRTNCWSARDDAIAFYIFAICPFLDIKKNLKLLPFKTTADIYARFKKIMKSIPLQTRLLQEYTSGFFCEEPLPFSESEIYAISRIVKDGCKNITKTVAAVPYLFNPFRTPKEISREAHHTKKKLQLNDYQSNYYVKRYLSFVKKVRSYKDIHSNYNYYNKISIEPQSLTKKLKTKTFDLELISKNKSFGEIETAINSQFRTYDLAILFGFMSLHKIDKTRVVIGRQSPKVKVDINLSMYCMQTVCRQHCLISFCSDGKFYLTVLGRDVFINGELFYKFQNIQLKNHDIIDIGGIPLMFIENPTFRLQVDELLEHTIKNPYPYLNEEKTPIEIDA